MSTPLRPLPTCLRSDATLMAASSDAMAKLNVGMTRSAADPRALPHTPCDRFRSRDRSPTRLSEVDRLYRHMLAQERELIGDHGGEQRFDVVIEVAARVDPDGGCGHPGRGGFGDVRRRERVLLGELDGRWHGNT